MPDLASVDLTPSERAALELFSQRVRDRLRSVVKEIVLFGSKARGDAAPDSDIDVLVLLDSEDWRLKWDVSEEVVAVGMETGVFVSALPMLVQHFKKSHQTRTSFALNVQEEGVPL